MAIAKRLGQKCSSKFYQAHSFKINEGDESEEWGNGKQIAVFYPWGNKWPSVSAITKPDPNSEFLNPFASRHHQLF